MHLLLHRQRQVPTCFGGKHPEAIIPEATCNQKPTVDGSHETVGTDFQHLTEIIAQMATIHWIVVSGVLCS